MVTRSSAAPGELELVRAFVNTLEVEDGSDELAEPAGLAAFLTARDLAVEGEITAAALRRAVALREAIRSLLVANSGGEDDPRAAGTLDSAARRARLTLRFRAGGEARQVPGASGVDGALGQLLAVVAAAQADGTWPRLKACRSETCRWAFYDRARNRSRTWCDMAVCGNRTKARAYRRRRGATRG